MGSGQAMPAGLRPTVSKSLEGAVIHPAVEEIRRVLLFLIFDEIAQRDGPDIRKIYQHLVKPDGNRLDGGLVFDDRIILDEAVIRANDIDLARRDRGENATNVGFEVWLADKAFILEVGPENI